MNIFPKGKQIMLIPRDFTLSSKAFSRIWNGKGSWTFVFPFPCHSVNTYCHMLQTLLWTHKALDGLSLAFPIVPCLPLCSIATLLFFHPLMYTMFPPTSGPLHTLTSSGTSFPFHFVNSYSFLRTQNHLFSRKLTLVKESVCGGGMCVHVCASVCVRVCTCVCVCFCRVWNSSPNTYISHLCTFDSYTLYVL